MLIDLHNHSFPKSDDSVLDVDTLIDLYKQTGIDAVCLTDHDDIWSIEEAQNLKFQFRGQHLAKFPLHVNRTLSQVVQLRASGRAPNFLAGVPGSFLERGVLGIGLDGAT